MQLCVFFCTHCTQYICISMCIFSGARAYSACPYLHLYIRTCVFVCQLDLNFSMECVSFVSVHLYAYECVWWWDLVVLSPSHSKNIERWRMSGREGGIQSGLCENCPQAELKQQGEGEAAAGRGEERRVFICSSARGRRRWRVREGGCWERWGRQMSEIGEGETWTKSVQIN